ncbi:MAG: thioredoxin-disulfide reductase [Deltaproteobacteria bacterium]|nr:thioredoxin-disulfide reductase [Deltaproteobacteria bacterium]
MYDLIIIGGGPAGLTAGLYNARARLDVLLLEQFAPGGQVLTTDRVENYPGFPDGIPGFPDGISGFELVDKMIAQAKNFGLMIRNEEVVRLELSNEKKIVVTNKGSLETKTIILASGATWKKLGIEGEKLLMGKGVSYCATCDGPFYRDQEVAVIGGGDSAVEEAIFLTRFASRIHLVHRRDRLRAIKLLQERAMAEKKIEFVWDTVPTKILGQNGVEGIELKNVKTGEITRKEVQGVFIFIGMKPNTDFVKSIVKLDENGFITTDDNMETSVPGLFAAGDIRSKQFRQIATAVGEGAEASYSVNRYLESIHQP